ncbi:uncharacterized protein LOC132733306 [Ruditapes philippinarum]|uniref:uncharacterized protein LOC132733306 n=1 Tax=Ruditapes philippinarum TaxID=129788 RepID=UPI00295BB369|nr:uncharacterized protein LOC132733306 [Ruditapes philippinarum]
MANTIGSNLALDEIDRSHRVGTPKAHETRPRDIIVKFVSYRARQKLYSKRASLKSKGYKNSYINEDLTKKRSSLLFEARQLVKHKSILSTWSSDGTILAKDKFNQVHVINSEEDLAHIKTHTYAEVVLTSGSSGS